MQANRVRLTHVLAVLGLACGAGVMGCAGGKGIVAGEERATEKDSKGKAKTAKKTVEEPYADDLRKYIDQQDPLTDGSFGSASVPVSVLDEPSHADAFAFADAAPSDEDPPAKIEETPVAPEELELEPEDPANVTPFGPQASVNDGEATAETPEEKVTRLMTELRGASRELRTGGEDGSAEAIELLAMHLLQAEGAATELEALEAKLPAAQKRTLATLRTLLDEVKNSGEESAALDAHRVARLLTSHATTLASDRLPLRITASALCTSVESFGRYTKFPSNSFLQGRTQPVIVYAALENFSQRSPSAKAKTTAFPTIRPDAKKDADRSALKSKSNGWGALADGSGAADDLVVELTQSIALHTESDDLVVWRAPEASIRDLSRDQRRDYYLVQRVDLPSRLTLGRYNLKITVRDVATGAADESIIPIQIVADPSLARAR